MQRSASCGAFPTGALARSLFLSNLRQLLRTPFGFSLSPLFLKTVTAPLGMAVSPALVTSAPAGLPACAAAPPAPLLPTQRRPGTHPRGLGNGPVEVVGLLVGCPASGLAVACQDLHSGDWGRPSGPPGPRGVVLVLLPHTKLPPAWLGSPWEGPQAPEDPGWQLWAPRSRCSRG